MARLDRMVIQGIRSFGPEENDSQRIKFFSPLTLILGQNGCGKTTIIESLKYAVTGDAPPGANRGQLFVHDPKISRKVETHGRIQLQFRDLRGDKLLVTRLMQLSQKAKKMEFKTRDNSLRRLGRNGEQADITGRCADIDLEICASLGVSKSILNNVIFCHQEDSAWPLDEGKKVKEKFDDIFDATKHNKYLEHIRMKRKEVLSNMKLVDNNIGHLRTVKDEVVSKRRQLDEANSRMQVSRDQIEKHNEKLQPIMDRLKLIHEREYDISKIYTDSEKKKTELKGIEGNQHDLRKNIKNEFQGSTADLEEYIGKFHVEVEQKETNHNELNVKLAKLEKEDRKLQDSITQEEVKKGRYQKELEQQKQRVESRNKQLSKLGEDMEVCDRMSTALSYTQLAEDEVNSLMNKVNKNMKECEAALEELGVQCKKEEDGLQDKVYGYRDETVSVNQQLELKSKEIKNTRDEVKKTLEEIGNADMSASKRVRVEAKLNRVIEELKEVEKSVNIDDLKEEIKQNTEKQNRLEDEREVLEKEINVLQEQSSAQAELDILKENKSTKEAEFRKLKNKNEDTLKHLLKTIPEQGIKYELKLCIDTLGQEIRDMNSTLSSKQKELTTLETNRKHLMKTIKGHDEDLKVKEEMVFDSCGNQNYDDVVKRVHGNVQELQDQKGTLSSSEYMFRRYIQKLQQPEPCCPLCHRGFDLEADVRELVNELNSKVREVPSRLRDNNKKLDSETEKYKKLLELKPTYESITTLKNNEIPNLRNELSQIEKKIGDVRNDIENLESQMMEPQTDKEMAEKVQPDVVLMDQHHSELQKLQQEIEKIEAKLPSARSTRSMQQVQNEQEKLKSEIYLTRRALEVGQRRLMEQSERLQKLREERTSLATEKLEIEKKILDRKQLEEKQEELQGLEVQLKAEEIELREKLGLSRKQLDTATKELSKKKLENGEKLKGERKKFSEYQKRVDDIHRYNREIKDFEQQGIEEKLMSVEQSLLDYETMKDTVVKSIQDINTKLVDLKSELARQEMKKRELDDNLKLRHMETEAIKLRRKIEELQQKLGDMKHETLLTEKMKLQNEVESINRERSHAEGRLKEQQTHIQQLRDDLRKPLYKTAEKEYMENVIKRKVQDKTANDLDYYYQATEWAMFNFHREKMREINTIIRELWRQIYRGNDIDYIEIKTDVPEQSSADKKRNYNYRVVQMKNDVEIDMRGRCSAGQKVLASLIIRMALAETFSANCGMLALDEPTTNLDRENVESMSTALADIVNTRMAQKNFQLVIITHDEEFLDRLSKVEKLEEYYRVSRNQQGKSVIEKYRIDR